jgi:hypothetical protein
MARIYLNNNKSIEVASDFFDGVQFLDLRLQEEFSGSAIGDIWPLAEVIVRSGADWIGWLKYYNRLRPGYLLALGDRDEYRYGRWETEKDRKADMWKHCEIAISLRTNGYYVPDEVQMPQFIEGIPARPSIFRKMADEHNLPMDVLYQYFLRSFDSCQFADGLNENYDEFAWSSLRKAGIVSSGDAIPTVSAVGDLTMKEMRAVLRQLGEKSEPSLWGNKRKIADLASADEARIRKAISNVRDWENTFMVHPPPGMSWKDFQSVRQQIKGMAVALGDIYCGLHPRKHKVDYDLLLS